MKTKFLERPANPWSELIELSKRMKRSESIDPEDLNRLRHLAGRILRLLPCRDSTMQTIRRHLIEKIAEGASRACMLTEIEALKMNLDYDGSPALERLLIEHLLIVRLRLIHAEHNYNQCVVNQSVPLQRGAYWDALLSSSQARFLRAIESLARVRRLARNTPPLQINIASDGGKQVNVQAS